jgi:hypothetical protein
MDGKSLHVERASQHHCLGDHCEVIPKEVKAEFRVCNVSDVACIRSLPLLRLHLCLDETDRQAEKLVDLPGGRGEATRQQDVA